MQYQVDLFQYIKKRRWKKKFPNEKACRNFLFQHRWPNGFKCPKCNNTHFYMISKRNLYECSYCHHQTSLIAGTIMHKTRVPLRKWFKAICILVNQKNKITAAALSKTLGVTKPTGWLLKKKIEKAKDDPDTLDFILKIAEVE